MGIRCTVTTELITPWWLKVLRFLKICKPMDVFHLVIYGYGFKPKDIVQLDEHTILLVISVEEYVH